MEGRDLGSYLGLRNLDAYEWQAGYEVGTRELLRRRSSWKEVNDQISNTLRLDLHSTTAWWGGYGCAWADRDAKEDD